MTKGSKRWNLSWMLLLIPGTSMADAVTDISVLRVDYESVSLSKYCVMYSDGAAPSGAQGVTFACHRFVGTGAGLRHEIPVTPAWAVVTDLIYARGKSGDALLSAVTSVSHAVATVGVAWNFSVQGQVSLQAGYSTFVPVGVSVLSAQAQWQPALGVFVQRRFVSSTPQRFLLRAGYLRTQLDDYYMGLTTVEALIVQAGMAW